MTREDIFKLAKERLAHIALKVRMMEQFKVGDFVQVKSNSDATLINSGRAVEFTGKVVSLHPRNGICVHPFDRNPIEVGWYLPEEVTLWKPKEGEWCWFWSGYSKYSLTLGRFVEYSEEEKLYFSYNGVVYMSYEYCEPFIGELPTIILN